MTSADYKSKLMSEVLNCIADLKDVKGSPQHKIVDYILLSKKIPAKKAEILVKQTLKSGVRSGLIKEIDGKYKLGMDRKEYNVLKGMYSEGKKAGSLPIMESRRRRAKRRRSRRRSRSRRGRRSPKRRRKGLDVESNEEASWESKYTYSSYLA